MARVEAKEISAIEGADLISTLPDPLLCAIISLLPGTEGVRTCVLSKRWEMVWKHISNLSFDQIQILKPLIQANPHEVYLNRDCDVWVDPNKNDQDLDVIDKTERLISSVLDSHFAQLESCIIRHLPESCVSGYVVVWIKKLLEEKKVKKLSLEQGDPLHLAFMQNSPQGTKYYGNTLDLPFEIFSSFEEFELKNYYLRLTASSDVFSQVLRTLTFKNVNVKKHDWEGILTYCLCLENLTLDNCKMMKMVKINSPRLKYFRICRMVVSEIEVFAINLEIFEIDTVICKPQKLTFETPKVHVLRSCCDDSNVGVQHVCWVGSKLLQSKNTLHAYASNQRHQGSTSSFVNMFENLVTLCINLDLEKVKNAIALSSALKSCPMLQNLEINSQVNDNAKDYDGDEHNEEDYFPFPKIIFWREMEPCDCVNHQLKTLSIKGFVGEELEVEFLIYIITKTKVMKKITIWFVDDCSWDQAIKTRCLLSFVRASPNLSITLNPGPIYMANKDANFDTWISTLRN